MITIIASSYTEGVPQTDGRVRVTETHLRSDQRVETAEYLAGPEIDRALVMANRAQRLNEQFAAEEAATGAALENTLLTMVEFERLFSDAEFNVVIPFIEGGFETNEYLTPEQKTTVRRGVREYKNTRDGVNLRDPRTIELVYMLEALGMLDYVGRAAELIGG